MLPTTVPEQNLGPSLAGPFRFLHEKNSLAGPVE